MLDLLFAGFNMLYGDPFMRLCMKGRTSEQKEVIKYFFGSAGCLGKVIGDNEYEAIVMGKAKSMDFKKKAMAKIGLDESQVSEVAPIHFEDYVFPEDAGSGSGSSGVLGAVSRALSGPPKSWVQRGKDGVWRSSVYQISWIFFSATQVYVYQYTFNTDTDEKKESTEEYFYKDITNFATVSDTVEKEYISKMSCTGSPVWARSQIAATRFRIAAAGGSLLCAMKQNDYTEKAIQGMKAKLREKKEG